MRGGVPEIGEIRAIWSVVRRRTSSQLVNDFAAGATVAKCVQSLGEDIGGSLWLSISDEGVMKLANSGLTSYGERDGLHHVGAIFEDRAHQLCLRGSVLGDSRRSVFEGARLDLVNAKEPKYNARYGCFDGRRFDWFTLAWGPALRPWPGMSDTNAVVG